MENIEVIKLEGITKLFPGVRALHNVNFSLRKGEVHALMGENGAGKSTLIKVLMGAYIKDEGKIFIDGKEANISSPSDAQSYGLHAVYQDVTLAPHLSVAENFFFGHLPKKTGMIDWKKMTAETTQALSKIKLNINPKRRLKDLTPSEQEMVCIAKVVYENAKVVVFDEPTALLSNEETEMLFHIIDNLKKQGIAIIYISHRIEEVFKICDRITVLRDGETIETRDIGDVTEDKLISMMVGRDLGDMFNIQHHASEEEVLRVQGLTKGNRCKNIHFSLHKGEILGMFGLVGSGRTDIVRCIFGADKPDAGEVFINSQPVAIKSPRDAIHYGIGLLPEDRKVQGLALKLSVSKNINLGVYGETARFGVVSDQKEISISKKYIESLHIKTPSLRQKVKNLSGGNQQKVIIAKWLNENSKIFIFDEPTVGVDVGAKKEIYQLLNELTKTGNSIILISSYLPEVMGLSDRVLVMYEGECTGIVNTVDTTDEDILKLASGIALNKGSESDSVENSADS